MVPSSITPFAINLSPYAPAEGAAAMVAEVERPQGRDSSAADPFQVFADAFPPRTGTARRAELRYRLVNPGPNRRQRRHGYF